MVLNEICGHTFDVILRSPSGEGRRRIWGGASCGSSVGCARPSKILHYRSE